MPVDLLIVVHLLVLELEAVSVLTLLAQVLAEPAVVGILAEDHLAHHEVDTVVVVHQAEAALSVVTVVEADVDEAEL